MPLLTTASRQIFIMSWTTQRWPKVFIGVAGSFGPYNWQPLYAAFHVIVFFMPFDTAIFELVCVYDAADFPMEKPVPHDFHGRRSYHGEIARFPLRVPRVIDVPILVGSFAEKKVSPPRHTAAAFQNYTPTMDQVLATSSDWSATAFCIVLSIDGNSRLLTCSCHLL